RRSTSEVVQDFANRSTTPGPDGEKLWSRLPDVPCGGIGSQAARRKFVTIALNEAAEAPGPASGARSRRRFTGRDAAAVVADPSSARPLSSVVDEPGRLRTNQSVGMAVIDLGSETGIDLTPQSGYYLFSPVRVPAPEIGRANV